jgi:hypothetical protein
MMSLKKDFRSTQSVCHEIVKNKGDRVHCTSCKSHLNQPLTAPKSSAMSGERRECANEFGNDLGL